MGRSGLALLVSCTLAAVAIPARADEGDHQKAAASFKAARADIAAGNCAAAMPKLEESLAYEPSVGALLSMADCYEQVDLLAAWRQLQDAAALAASKGDEREAIARERAAGLEARLSMLRFVYAPSAAPPDPNTLEVHIDGARVLPYVLRRGTLAITPGAHRVEVSAPHKKAWHGQVIARTAGTSVDVDVTLEDEAAPQAAPPAPVAAPLPAPAGTPPVTPAPAEAPAPSGARTAGLVVGGVGVAGLAVGGIFGIVALTDNSHLRDACGGNVHQCTGDTEKISSTRSAAQTAATVSTIGFIAGGVALAAGVVLFVTAPSSPRHVEVGAAAIPGGGGLRLGGDF
jgi:hypothetical protein